MKQSRLPRITIRESKWPRGAKKGILVAGGHGPGSELNQLNEPRGIQVLDDESI